jgi:Sortase domain
LLRHVHVSAQLVGEASLAIVLVGALVFSWSDGAPDTFVEAGAPAAPGWASLQGLGNTFDFGQAGRVATNKVVAMQPPSLERVPTAPPIQLLIPSLNVHRAVEMVRAGRSGVMNLPANAWNAGWYGGGPTPGAPGDAVIEGHAGYPGQQMIFGRLVLLRPGDQIVVVLKDGSRRLFLMESMRTVPVGEAPDGMAQPYGPPRLTLITCTGHFDQDHYSYSSRLVVEARYQGVI